MKKLMGAAVVAAMLAAVPAQAACWKTEAAAAAKVRDLQSMLMVAALRCRSSGYNLLPEYNAFVRENRAAITMMNDRLKSHFVSAHGAAGGQREYDRFTTALANAYGAGGDSSDCTDMAALARDSTGAGSAELVRIADREGLAPRLPGGRCPTILATRQ